MSQEHGYAEILGDRAGATERAPEVVMERKYVYAFAATKTALRKARTDLTVLGDLHNDFYALAGEVAQLIEQIEEMQKSLEQYERQDV